MTTRWYLVHHGQRVTSGLVTASADELRWTPEQPCTIHAGDILVDKEGTAMWGTDRALPGTITLNEHEWISWSVS